MKKFNLLIVAMLCFIGVTFGQSASFDSPKIEQELREELSKTSQQNQLHRVIVMMEGQYDQSAIERGTRFMDKGSRRSYVINEMKRFTGESQADVMAFMWSQNANTVRNLSSLWVFNGFTCETTADVIEALAGRADVKMIYSDQEQQMIPEVWNPEPVGKQLKHSDGRSTNAWNITKVNADDVWVYNGTTGYTGDGVVVAVIDSGVNYNHTDITDNMWDGGSDYPHHGYDWVNGDDDPMDDHGHGSHCAGTVAGYGTNGIQTGIATGAKVMALKTLSASGSGYNSNTCYAIQFALEHGADVLSMSLGTSGEGGFDYYRDLMVTVMNAGVVASVAASNDGNKLSQYPIPFNIGAPGNCPPPFLHPDQKDVLEGGISAVICIGATNQNDEHTSFTSVGPATWAAGSNIGSYNDYPYTAGSATEIGLIRPDVAAPGYQITSLDYSGNTGYCDMNGTSMATPCAAGVMALMLEADPSLLPREIDSILEYTAVRCENAISKSNYTGSGRIDAYAAIQAVLGTCEAPTNLTATVDGHDVALSWTAATDVTSYNVYRNGTEIASGVTGSSYNDNNLSIGYYTYNVKSNCGDNTTSVSSNYVDATINYNGPVVTDLAGTANGNTATLSWTSPESSSGSLYYATDYYMNLGYGDNSLLYWGQKYPASMLSAYAGMAVQSINITTYYTDIEHTLYIYQGSETSSSNLLATKTFTPTTSYNEVALDAPVPVDYLQNLWVVCAAVGDYPMTIAQYYGDSDCAALYSQNGNSWNNYDGYSSCIEMVLSNGTYTYNVNRDDAVIAENIAVTTYSDNNLAAGTYSYTVTTNYYGGVSQASNAVEITIEGQDLVFHKLNNHTDVTSEGTYMIVDVTSGRALTSANGSASAPSAVEVSITGDSIVGNIDAELQWNFIVNDAGYIISPANNPEVFLYSTNSNNGVRIGTNENNVWELNITDASKPNYHGFKNVAFNRYLGTYNNQDWRTYTSIHNNIQNTQIEIFVLGEAPDSPSQPTPPAPTVISIAEARSLNTNEYALVQGVVTLIDGRNVYIQDETAGIDLYLNNNTVPSTLALGDMVQAYGKKAVYSGLVELTGINGNSESEFTIVSSGNEIPLAVKTIAEILADYADANMLQSTRVQIVGATIGAINTNGNTPVTQDGSTINIYKMPVVEGLEEGYIVTFAGVIGCYNNPQMRIASADDITFEQPQYETVATPTFSPAAGTYYEAQSVSISCATEDAVIYYTLDGTDPTAESTVYAEAIVISETTTVKAFAAMDGMLDSEVATAVYTIEINPPTPSLETSYVLITNTNALISGDKYIVVGVGSDIYKALGKQNNNNRAAVEVTPLSDTITIVPAAEAGEDAVYELTLGQDGDYWTLYDAANGGYLYAAGTGSSNWLKTIDTVDNRAKWSIEIASDGVATIKAPESGTTRNWMRYNNSSNIFSCYASGQFNVYLYKAGEIPTPQPPTYYTVSIAEGIANGTVAVEPSSAIEGETVIVTATPDSGYELATLTYSYEGNESIDIMEAMQFVMPAADVTVNATFSEMSSAATPTFTPAAGTYITAQEVTISCATEDATIYYTLDGTDPTVESTVYTEAFTVNATTTVKAFAVKENMSNSSVATAEYIIIEPVTIAEARSLNTNEYALVQGVVTLIDGRNVYIQDETAGIDLYLNNNTVPSTLALGDMVQAYGKKAVYSGLVELTGINGNSESEFTIVSSGNEIPLAVKTIAEILADYADANMLQSTRVQIVGATIGAINTNGNTPVTQDGSTINIYKMPVVEGLEEGYIVTFAGVIGCYNNPQMRIASADDITFEQPQYETVATPTFSPAAGTYYEAQSVSISCATEDAVIYYTLDGTDPTAESTVYVEAIVISETTTVKAFAAMDGMLDSEVATAVYTITEAPTPSEYVRVTDLAQLGNGSKVVFAARFNENANEYYAMTAQASGKPTGVLFTSAAETLPSTIVDEESTYYWTVAVNGDSYTFTNANGDVLGYTSGTNFATGGDNTAWAITLATSAEGTMVPNYSGFVVSNVNNEVRAIALNNNYNFGPYHTQNMTSGQAGSYNFFLDMFATEGSSTLVCATPTFTPASGTYYEVQSVSISCATEDAVIYYTLDGTDPTTQSTVYTEAIVISETTTVKAIAVKEGYENSAIATADYTIILGAVTVFNQDWEGDMNGWTFVTVEGIKPWTIAQYSGNHYAYGNGYNGGANEQWCISPAFSLNLYSNASLTFRNAKNYTGPDMQLFFSNNYDGENPATATWTELEFNKSTGSFAWAESGTIDLANFTGDACYIGFKYTSTETEAAAWEVDDIILMGFTSEPYLTVTPSALSGFTHIIGQGPSASQTFVLTAGNITPAPGGTTGSVVLQVVSPFSISLDDEDYDSEIYFEGITNLEPTTIYVRMNGAEIGQYTGAVNVYASTGNEAEVTLSGTVIEEPTPGDGWNRIYSLADLHDGDQVIIASRYDAAVGNGYYAMPAVVSGKPDGVLFTSDNNGGIESLPAEIANDANTYLWNVALNGNVITFVNAAGDTLGYSNSTNFAGNVNTEWNIALETSGDNAMIPTYTGFVITNGVTTNRGIAKNNINKFGAYSTSNINNADYNFYMDIFVNGGTVTLTVAPPVFSMAAGTYFDDIDVEIMCTTEGATIYYTLDGTDPTTSSSVYTSAIHISETTTLKAFGVKEGYADSNITTAEYVIEDAPSIITIAEAKALELNEYAMVQGVTTFVDGRNVYIQDETAGIVLYLNINTVPETLTAGDMVVAYGRRSVYNGLIELNDIDGTSTSQFNIISSGNELPLATVTIAEIMADYADANMLQSTRVLIEEATIGAINNNGNTPVAQGDDEMNIYKMPVVEGLEEGDIVTFIGVIGCYNNPQMRIASADDVEFYHPGGDDPILVVSESALSGFTYPFGHGPSTAQTFTVSGENLPPVPGSDTGGVRLEVSNPYYFEISLNGVSYSHQVTIQEVVGTLEPTTIYVRLKADMNVGNYQSTITIEDFVTVTVSLSGNVTPNTGVDENFASSVSIWNNVNELYVENSGGNTLQLVVYNLIGQPVLSATIATGSNIIRHDLAEGVYIVRMSDGKEMVGVKVAIRH